MLASLLTAYLIPIMIVGGTNLSLSLFSSNGMGQSSENEKMEVSLYDQEGHLTNWIRTNIKLLAF